MNQTVLEVPPLLQWAAVIAIIGLTLNGIGTIVRLVRPPADRSLEQLGPLLQSTTVTMAQIAENLRHLPTKAELASEMKDTRHHLVQTAESIQKRVEAEFRALDATLDQRRGRP